MNPKFINVGGQRFAYLESDGHKTSADSRSVLFVHGNSLSSRCFLRQMESPLGKKYRLIALDLPGHGLSAHAEDPISTYTASGLAGTVCEFVRALGLQDAVFVGLSLGGNILVEALDYLPSTKGLMLVGTFLPSLPLDMPSIVYPNPVLSSLFSADLTDDEIDAWVAALLKPGAVPPAFLAEDIRKSDKRLRACLGAAIAQGGHRDEVLIVGGLKIPLAFVIGAQDQITRESYLRGLRMPSLWQGRLQVISEAGHLAQWEQPERFNILLEEFITEVAS